MQEQIQLWTQKQKVELAVGSTSATNANKLEEMVQKSTANYWMKRLHKNMSELEKTHQAELAKLKMSFTTQIEELNMVVGSLSQQLTKAFEAHKSDEKVKLILITIMHHLHPFFCNMLTPIFALLYSNQRIQILNFLEFIKK